MIRLDSIALMGSTLCILILTGCGVSQNLVNNSSNQSTKDSIQAATKDPIQADPIQAALEQERTFLGTNNDYQYHYRVETLSWATEKLGNLGLMNKLGDDPTEPVVIVSVKGSKNPNAVLASSDPALVLPLDYGTFIENAVFRAKDNTCLLRKTYYGPYPEEFELKD